MYYLEGLPGRTAFSDGKEYLFFSGYNYLGMNGLSAFQELLNEGISKYGWLFPSARISNTRLALYEECEALFSAMTGAEESVIFSSGFNAGRCAALIKPDILNAPGAHPAIQINKASINDYKSWSSWFVNAVNTETGHSITGMASDSADPLNAKVNDFSFLKQIHKDIVCIIDDSHGIGLIGNDGKGIATLVPGSDHLDYIFTFSLSKAFGISGGVVSCSKATAAALRATPDYCAATAPLPSQMYALLKGQDLYARQREKLKENIAYFAECITGLPGIRYHADLPVFVLPKTIDEKQLSGYGLMISSFAYPDPEGDRLNRIVLNALHTRQDLEYAAECLQILLN